MINDSLYILLTHKSEYNNVEASSFKDMRNCKHGYEVSVELKRLFGQVAFVDISVDHVFVKALFFFKGNTQSLCNLRYRLNEAFKVDPYLCLYISLATKDNSKMETSMHVPYITFPVVSTLGMDRLSRSSILLYNRYHYKFNESANMIEIASRIENPLYLFPKNI